MKELLDIFSYLPKKFLLHGNIGGKKLPDELAELIFVEILGLGIRNSINKITLVYYRFSEVRKVQLIVKS